MAHTEHSDLYASIHEEGVDDVVSHLRRNRPSLFNYASGRIADRPKAFLCRSVEAARLAEDRGAPLVRRIDPVPIIGTGGRVALDFCFQITELTLDAHPSNSIDVPAEADLTIDDQQFGVFVRVCVGLACPDDEAILDVARDLGSTLDQPGPVDDPIVPRPNTVHCFCLDAHLTGGLELQRPGASKGTVSIEESPAFTVRDVEVTAAESDDGQLPTGLREAAECYLQFVVTFSLLPRLASAVEEIVPTLVRMLDNVLADLGTSIAITTPTTPGIPDNPAVEDDELRLFLNLDVEVTS